MKITDVSYLLPMVEAMTPGQRVKGENQNESQVVRGVIQQTGLKGDFMVKYMASARMYPEAAMRELLALFIAMEWDIPTPKPAIIHISEQFALLFINEPNLEVVSKSIGWNFGSEFLDHSFDFHPEISMNQHEKDHAKEILLFDLFIQTGDRSNIKPNMRTNGINVFPLDHELSFGFAMDILPNPKPWQFAEKDRVWIEKNVLWQLLRGQAFDFQKLSLNIDRLNSIFWNKAMTIIPPSWQGTEFTKIRKTLELITENKTQFIHEVKTVLA